MPIGAFTFVNEKPLVEGINMQTCLPIVNHIGGSIMI